VATSRRRLAWTVLIVAAAVGALAILDRTGHAAWAQRLSVTLLILAALVMVLRNRRE